MEGKKRKGKGRKKVTKKEKQVKSEDSENDDEIELKKEKQEENELDGTSFIHKDTKTKSLSKKTINSEGNTKKKKEEKIVIPNLIEEETKYEFEFETEEASSFIGFLNSIKLLLPGKFVTLIFTKNGLYHVSRDVGKYAISETTLNKQDIDRKGEYRCVSLKDESYISLTCDINVLLKKIDTKRAEMLRLCVETGNDNILFVLNIRNTATITKDVELKSIDEDDDEEINQDEINIPRYPKDLNPTVRVKGCDFIADLRKVKFTYVKLRIQKDTMIIRGYNQDKDPFRDQITYGKWDNDKPTKFETFIPFIILTSLAKLAASTTYLRFYTYEDLPLKVLTEAGSLGFHTNYIFSRNS